MVIVISVMRTRLSGTDFRLPFAMQSSSLCRDKTRLLSQEKYACRAKINVCREKIFL